MKTKELMHPGNPLGHKQWGGGSLLGDEFVAKRGSSFLLTAQKHSTQLGNHKGPLAGLQREREGCRHSSAGPGERPRPLLDRSATTVEDKRNRNSQETPTTPVMQFIHECVKIPSETPAKHLGVPFKEQALV